MKTPFSNSYPAIQSYERFKELVYQRGLVILQEKEPHYCERFRTCETLGLEPGQTVKECNPLLSGKFKRFVDLLEAIYEVGYYLKRLSETSRLLEVTAPTTPNQQISESSWFVYNLDFYWHVEYSLEERIIKFLTIFKRMYKSQSTEETALLEVWIEANKMLKTEATKKMRDPLTHTSSQGVQGWRNEHSWEAALILGDKPDFMEIYDNRLFESRDVYLSYTKKWVQQRFEATSLMFDRLCSFSLERLELK